MISINLLPDVKKELLRIRRERNLVVSISILAVGGSFVALGVLGGILGGLNIAKVVMENGVNKSKATINSAIEDKQLNEYLTIQNQLSQISDLKSQQLVYSRIMDYLVALNPASPNNAELSTVNLEMSGNTISATLEGKTQNFEALNVYKTTLASAELVYEEKSDDEDTTSDDDASASTSTDSADSSGDSGTNDNSTTDNTNAKREKLFSEVLVTEQGYSNDTDGGVTFTMSVVFGENAFSPAIDNDTVRVEIPKETTSDGDRNAPKTEDDEDDTGEQQTSGDGATGNGDNDQRQTFNTTETDDTTNISTGEGY